MAKKIFFNKEYLLELLKLNFQYKVIKDDIFDSIARRIVT